MKNFLFLLVLTVFSFGAKAQGLNTEYVQIKAMYDFQSEPGEYRVNEFLKHKFETYGFKVFSDKDPIPEDVIKNGCNELKCLVTRGNSMVITQVKVELVNCKGQVVYTTTGESRLKKRNKSYIDALRNAFEFSSLNNLKRD